MFGRDLCQHIALASSSSHPQHGPVCCTPLISLTESTGEVVASSCSAPYVPVQSLIAQSRHHLVFHVSRDDFHATFSNILYYDPNDGDAQMIPLILGNPHVHRRRGRACARRHLALRVAGTPVDDWKLCQQQILCQSLSMI